MSAVWASRPCAPSGPPANAPGPRYGIANGRNAGTCRGGGPLGGLLCKCGGAWRLHGPMAAVPNLRCLKNDCSLALRPVLFGYGLGFHGDKNRRMRCPRLVCSALAIGAVVCFGSDAHAREQPVFCDPPTVTVVARGAIVGGKRCNGPWGCRCVHWFCPQCSTLPTRPVSCPPSPLSCATSPLSCEWTTCAPLYRPPARARR
jgi:hypothetical protein